jgi:uracil-DNA glycosylase
VIANESLSYTQINAVDKYGGANLDKATQGMARGVVFLAWGAFAAKRVSHLSKVSLNYPEDVTNCSFVY